MLFKRIYKLTEKNRANLFSVYDMYTMKMDKFNNRSIRWCKYCLISYVPLAFYSLFHIDDGQECNGCELFYVSFVSCLTFYKVRKYEKLARFSAMRAEVFRNKICFIN